MAQDTTTTVAVATDEDSPPRYAMMIGNREWELEAHDYPVDAVELWDQNPRTLHMQQGLPKSEDEIAADLAATPGYDALKSSIRRQGQMERIYVRERPGRKPLVIEGNTRVAILRELRRENRGKPEEDTYKYVRAKILPNQLSDEDILFLQAAIHVRGSGVRNWSRYAQARFVYEAVTPQMTGTKPVTTQARLAEQMGKSGSWVSRLLSAYEFALRYEEHFDDEDGKARLEAIDQFSILEEISRAKAFGPKVRSYEDPATEPLREEVFDMVHAGVFGEYRDARFIQQFYEDDEKWRQLKEGTPGIASKLAAEVRAGESALGDRILAMPKSLERELEAKPEVFNEDHLSAIQDSMGQLETALGGAPSFVTRVRMFKNSLAKVALGDLEAIDPDELERLVDAIERIQNLAGHKIA